MLDALLPAVEAFDANPERCLGGRCCGRRCGTRSDRADGGPKGTGLLLGRRSAGVADPGATSSTLLVQAAARTLA